MDKKTTFKNFIASRTYRIVFVVFTCICIAVSLFCFQYYRRLQNTVVAESSSYLQEISKQIGNNVSRTINDNFAVLGTVSTVLKNAQVDSYKRLEPIIREQQTFWNFQSILLVDEDGVAYDAYGKTVTLSSEEYLRDVLVNKKQSMSSAQVVNNMECMLFAIPMENFSLNGVEIRALVAAYDLSTFDKILSVDAFNGQGYAHVIRRDGTMAIRSSSESAAVTGFNVLTSLGGSVFEGGNNIDKVKQDIVTGNSGLAIIQQGDRREYMAYAPLATQEWCLLTFVPVSVVNYQSESLMNVTILLCVIITVSFSVLIGFMMLSFYWHKNKLERIAYVDPITGGNTIQKFYEVAQDMLSKPAKLQYAMIYMNIEKFKVFNEQFGRRACDEMLCAIHQGITKNLMPDETVGRLFADNFCIWTEYSEEDVLQKRFNIWYEGARRYTNDRDAVWLMPIIECGVYVVSNDTMSFPQMVDRAKLSLKDTKQDINGKIHYAIYDDATRKRLFREKHLEDMMEHALETHEFKVYLQPKYRTSDETIGGAEALVRWQNPIEGMIYPDEFIDLFEKNGFVVQLDLWVFEEVCRTIRRWLDAGIEPMKISVNCSRVHLKNPKFLQFYSEICKKHNVLPRYLEIELTENVVFQDVEYLTRIIDDIHKAGFGCAMDDFGSGYSSLNMIQAIPVDTIKLDKIFFRNTSKDAARTKSVVGSVLSMAKALKLETVVEGVEERFQVDMLKHLDCDYIQGFYFAKPMSIEEFEKLAFEKTKNR